LVRHFLDFEKQDKNLSSENPYEYLKLLKYRSAVYDHIFWESREQFVFLMDNFIHDSIDMEEFEIAFSQLYRKTTKA